MRRQIRLVETHSGGAVSCSALGTAQAPYDGAVRVCQEDRGATRRETWGSQCRASLADFYSGCYSNPADPADTNRLERNAQRSDQHRTGSSGLSDELGHPYNEGVGVRVPWRLHERTGTTEGVAEGLWPPIVASIVLVESLTGRQRTDAKVTRFLKTADIREHVSMRQKGEWLSA